ncbi:hypothetical protein EOM09_07265 [bacterium]|nr:hypothetical protein [bacterium]
MGKEKTTEIKKYNYGKYLLIFIFFSVIFNMLWHGIEKNTISSLSAFLIVSVQALLDFSIFYFLVLWVYDLIRNGRKIKKPENTKVKKIINIIFIALFLLTLLSLIVQ